MPSNEIIYKYVRGTGWVASYVDRLSDGVELGNEIHRIVERELRRMTVSNETWLTPRWIGEPIGRRR